MFDKSLFQSTFVDDEKKLLYQNNAIEHEQSMFVTRNVDMNLKSSLFEKLVVIKNLLIFWFKK